MVSKSASLAFTLYSVSYPLSVLFQIQHLHQRLPRALREAQADLQFYDHRANHDAPGRLADGGVPLPLPCNPCRGGDCVSQRVQLYLCIILLDAKQMQLLYVNLLCHCKCESLIALSIYAVSQQFVAAPAGSTCCCAASGCST